MTRLFGIEDEFGEDALLGRLEGMKDVIEQVNEQFKNPLSILILGLLFSLYGSVQEYYNEIYL